MTALIVIVSVVVAYTAAVVIWYIRTTRRIRKTIADINKELDEMEKFLENEY